MNVLIIGGVAAGTKTAAKLKRMAPDARVTLLAKDKDISYAGCGLPYYVGGAIPTRDQLIVNTPAAYAALTGVEVRTGMEAIHLDAAGHTVTVRDLATGAESQVGYDACVIATGASPAVPPLPGVGSKGVFCLRTPDDAEGIRRYVEEKPVRRAVVVGGGFIGLEIAENLMEKQVSVTVAEMAGQIMPNVLDPEMAGFAKKQLQEAGLRVLTGVKVEEILTADGAATGVRTAAGTLPADLVVLSVGVRPNTAWLADTGMEMFKGTILVDDRLRTSLPDVYAAGDCVMVKNRITGERQWSAMGSSANYEGRTLGRVLAGEAGRYPGVLGTGVVKLPGGLNAARTGLTEAQAKQAGYDVETALAVTDDKAHYYPDSAWFVTKLVADKASHKLLGAQVLGPGAVDKMIDVAVTSLALGARLEDLDGLDLAYAPPFSTAIHPFVQAVYVLGNKLCGAMCSMTPAQYAAGEAKGWTVVDANGKPTIPGARWVDLTKVDGPVEGLGKDENILLVCTRGRRAYLLQRRLMAAGYTHTRVLEGATFFNEVKVEGVKTTVSPENITRVKALGFLHDKNTPDCFNARVITRNGKITAEESRAIAEAAALYGSGAITMTTRLTLEIQGVPYANIQPLRDYLAQYGLETGGTGSKVRPVVSCKGTTCQYGLIDTFALSEEIHERFFHGYAGVKLPHKFKIAVGGCPNNCVKPDLNDLGIIGQRVPQIDLDKCRGCKVCQVERACPIQVAQLKDGKIQIDPNACNHCGRCVGKCPFGALTSETTGYKIYVGGRWGKKVAQGHALDKVFTSKEEVLKVVEKAILLFREQGITGKRFADTIARLGFESVQQQLLADDLLARKQENLAAQKHLKGGATC